MSNVPREINLTILTLISVVLVPTLVSAHNSIHITTYIIQTALYEILNKSISLYEYHITILKKHILFQKRYKAHLVDFVEMTI